MTAFLEGCSNKRVRTVCSVLKLSFYWNNIIIIIWSRGWRNVCFLWKFQFLCHLMYEYFRIYICILFDFKYFWLLIDILSKEFCKTFDVFYLMKWLKLIRLCEQNVIFNLKKIILKHITQKYENGYFIYY